jgi:hypothetical protein
MAAGDLSVFDEAKAYMLDGDFGATDSIKLTLITNAVVPTDADAVPGMNAGATTTYTEVAAGGNFTAGGEVLDTWANFITEAAGTMTADSGTRDCVDRSRSNSKHGRGRPQGYMERVRPVHYHVICLIRSIRRHFQRLAAASLKLSVRTLNLQQRGMPITGFG